MSTLHLLHWIDLKLKRCSKLVIDKQQSASHMLSTVHSKCPA